MTTGHIVGSVEVLRRAIAGRSVGLVPTMGALHDGHRSLIQRAAAENEVAVVSIFVNPNQFNDPEDLAKYPRDLPADAEAAIAAGASVIYAPSPDGVY
ncbi:MAG: pantoate--beta-alanine ligase, partial [Chloroflexota bacterium]|nr:pantoate--beta-alanine ligase [Chloroflexota bacterium]